MTATVVKSDILIDLFIIVFYINVLGNVLAAIYQLVKGRWYFILPQILVSATLLVYFYLSFMIAPHDYYGAHKTIPDNIDIYEPLNTPPPHKPPLNITPTSKDMAPFHLAINMGSQPGMYRYFTDYQPTELGRFYIKAYEVTSMDRLSADSIKYRSEIMVDALEPKTNHSEPIIYSGEFTIFEGSWGDKYGARVELWFAPNDGDKEYKITERNYIVEGWMR